MHLAGWNFTIHEEGVNGGTMNVIDVRTSDFFKARDSALQQYKPGSTVADFRPLSEEECLGSLVPGSSRKWISVNETPERADIQEHPDLWPLVTVVNFITK